MSRITSLALALVVVVGWLTAHVAEAQIAPGTTTITVPKMCCGGCAKKVAAKLAEVPGIGGVQPNVQAKTIMIVAKPQAVLSPRALWEAVEQAGQQPAKLEGPQGTFTAKPPF